ncbi:MAG: hypothetical protein U5K30_08020 [Acidimicrobiales bacterium]|nr:hypothetical protein [Acidimicrobiales bacterium]
MLLLDRTVKSPRKPAQLLGSAVIEVLVVCTGNICRSPMAAGLLRHRLSQRGIDAHIHSAGLVTQDRPASEPGIDAMARRDIDIRTHRSRRLLADMVETADLVIGMERNHVREAAVLAPDGLARTFTLPELARRCQAAGARGAEESLPDYLGRIAAGRRPTDLLGDDPADEVDDPYGRSVRDYERTAVEIEGLVDLVVAHLFP